MRNSTHGFFLQSMLLIALTLGLAACGDDNSVGAGHSSQLANTTGTEVVFAGSVGDGPVTGASINVISARGHTLGTFVSDSKATYQARVRPAMADYPLRLVVSGGIDLVTGRQPDFQMESVMVRATETVVNINPFSTLVTQVAGRLPGGLTEANISTAKSLVMGRLSFGLNRSALPDPISTPITARNVAQMVKASEALGEAVRRTRDLIKASGQPMTGNTVVRALAADMTDGHPDGLGRPGVNPTVTAVFNVVTGQVLVEALSNNLRVDGVIATGVIDQSILSTSAGVSSNQLTNSVRVTADLLTEARVAVAAAQVLDSSGALASVANALGNIAVSATPAGVASVLPASSTNSLNIAINRVSTASTAQVNAVNQTVFAMGDTGSGSAGPGNDGTGTAASGSFSLRWTAPATRSDGTPLSLSEINGYNVYYGTRRGNYPNRHVVSNGSATNTTVGGLVSGVYYLVMTTYDNAGREGQRSGEVTRNVP